MLGVAGKWKRVFLSFLVLDSAWWSQHAYNLEEFIPFQSWSSMKQNDIEWFTMFNALEYNVEWFRMFNALEYDLEWFRIFNALNDIECLCNDLECFMLSNVSKACPCIYLVIIVKWKDKKHRWPTIWILPLWLTIHSPLLCCWHIVSICIDSILSGLVILARLFTIANRRERGWLTTGTCPMNNCS